MASGSFVKSQTKSYLSIDTQSYELTTQAPTHTHAAKAAAVAAGECINPDPNPSQEALDARKNLGASFSNCGQSLGGIGVRLDRPNPVLDLSLLQANA